MNEMSSLDRLILNSIQSGFPLEPRPYEALARRLNEIWGLRLSGDEVLKTVNSLKVRGFIRRLGAVFNASSLGYRSVLCAARVPAEKVEAFGRLVSASPQVTHNYIRSDSLNVWFTFTARHEGETQSFIKELKAASGVQEIYELEAEKLFKIKVEFKLSI